MPFVWGERRARRVCLRFAAIMEETYYVVLRLHWEYATTRTFSAASCVSRVRVWNWGVRGGDGLVRGLRFQSVWKDSRGDSYGINNRDHLWISTGK